MKLTLTPAVGPFIRNFIILMVTIFTAQAQVDLSYYLPDTESLNPEITTPEEFLGFQIGDWHLSHSQQMYYLKQLAQESDRIQFHVNGKSHEDRPMIHLFISDPENLVNLETIREEHLRWSDPGSSQSEVSPDRPLIVWQGYSIHGNEPSGANAAVLVAYYLAASSSPEILNILKNTVIVFYPSFNPDGLQRFSTWVNMNKSKTLNPDNQDREYDEVWPAGRTNHYGFDLNRDWLPVQQPESTGKIALYQQWRPNILTDHHEMGTNTTFFFQPGIPSRNNPMTPEMNIRMTEEIGKFHAKALDSIATLYYSRESFDDFYYGKGSTYPDIQGCVGILFEQASSRGHIQNSKHGLLTFPYTIRNQVVTSFSTLRAGLNLREELQNYQREFFHGLDLTRQQGYVFGDGRFPHKTKELARIIMQHDIAVYQLDEDVKVGDEEFESGVTYYVPLNQRQQTLVRTIFETNTTFQDSLFYDVSAWTLPLAFDLPYSLVSQPSAVTLIEDELTHEPTFFRTSEYAYILGWEHYLAPKILYRLLHQGIRAFVATKPFTYDGQNFEYGSILIPVQNQDKDVLESVLREAVEEGIPVFDIPTGSTGGVNLGSANFNTIEKPRVGLLVGDRITVSTAGEVWHLLDTRYEIPVTRLDGRKFSSYDLDAYNVLVLAGGSIIDVSKDKLNGWLRNGGTLITLGSGGRWMANQFPGHFTYRKVNGIDSAEVRYDEMDELYGARVTGGAIVKSRIDMSHPLNYGYRDVVLPMFKNNNYVFERSPLAFKNPIIYDEDQPLWSGYLHASNQDLIAGGSAVQVASVGSGRIVNFADDVNFRGFWYGTNRLFANAIYFGRLINSRSTQ